MIIIFTRTTQCLKMVVDWHLIAL